MTSVSRAFTFVITSRRRPSPSVSRTRNSPVVLPDRHAVSSLMMLWSEPVPRISTFEIGVRRRREKKARSRVSGSTARSTVVPARGGSGRSPAARNAAKYFSSSGASSATARCPVRRRSARVAAPVACTRLRSSYNSGSVSPPAPAGRSRKNERSGRSGCAAPVVLNGRVSRSS